MCKRYRRLYLSVLKLVSLVFAAHAMGAVSPCRATEANTTSDLADMSLEDLTSMKVTSVSRRAEDLMDTSAAVYVITQEDIRRSGAKTIPEALRMAPGIHVAQFSSRKWAVSTRGFNDEFANKMLVLIDGRTVYSLLFSGVLWDVQDYTLEDIDRIEIIRGPGATMWGANAVNGVINIITRSSEDTLGNTAAGYVSQGQGSDFRSGMLLSRDIAFRFYAKDYSQDPFPPVEGGEAIDDWRQSRGGFRLDWEKSARDMVEAHGDIYSGAGAQRILQPLLSAPYAAEVEDPVDVSGGNLFARWTHRNSDHCETALQIYYDHTKRTEYGASEDRAIWDIDFQKQITKGRRKLAWGLGYRYTTDDVDGNFYVDLDPGSASNRVCSAFIQSEYQLKPGRTALTIGSKFEVNDFTGFEIQPSLRFLHIPNNRTTLWAAVSRAVRTPCRWERDGNVAMLAMPDPMGSGLTILTRYTGNENFGTESMIAYEAGYRVRPTSRFFVDLTAFYNDYANVRSFSTESPRIEFLPVPHIVVPFHPSNQQGASSHGFEVASNWSVSGNWKLALTCAFLKIRFTPDVVETDPRQNISLRSYINLPRNLEFDTSLYYVSDLPDLQVADYLRLDFRLGWRPKKDFNFSIGMRNALDRSHQEFRTSFSTLPTLIERSLYASLTWRQ